MTADDAIDALLQQKLQLEEHLPALLAACKTDAEAAALRSSYQHAVNQWNTAVNQKLVADEALLGVLVGQLADIRTQVETAIANADEFSSVLNRIVAGITVGGKILMLLR